MHAEIRARVLYLPEYLYRGPLRVLRAWWQVRRWPSYREAWHQWLRDLARDPTPNRIRRFGQALVLAAELPQDVYGLHAHFLHTPASVTRYAALLKRLPWSGSAHAKDIWTTPEWEKREKLASCTWLVTCTAANRDHLAALAPPGRVELVYHGVDLTRFPRSSSEPGRRDGRNAADPIVLLSVGRLVEKKGTDVLLEALARLPNDVHWRLVHAGGGPQKRKLQRRARALGIAERVVWRGALRHDELLREYRAADLFVLACRIARSGDRDGLPNVLMEAQSQSLACVATRVAAIPELIEDHVTGVLVDPESPDQLATALNGLIGDPGQRRRLGRAGQARLTGRFGIEQNLAPLAERFGVGSLRSGASLRTATG
ncbi:MAG: glycosyltransferase family 4 protein [Burkholderiales bacterium]